MPREMADEFTAMGFLIFEDPTRAIAAVAALARLAQGFREAARAACCEVDRRAARFPPGPINEAEAKRLLGAAGIPFAPEKIARTRDEAVAAANEIGFPVVLKVLSPDIAHKSEAGGVVLGLRNARRGRERLRHDDGARRRARAEGTPRRRAGRAHDRGRRRDRDRRRSAMPCSARW